jgi:hypothetical protein
MSKALAIFRKTAHLNKVSVDRFKKVGKLAEALRCAWFEN